MVSIAAGAAGAVGAGPAGCSGPSFKSTCSAAAPSAEATAAAKQNGDGTAILPDGRKITPAGTLITVGGFPLNMRVLPGDRYVVVTDGDIGDEHLRIVDTMAPAGSNAIVFDRVYPGGGDRHAPALFYGLALTSDGKTLYVSDGGYDPSSDPDGTKHYSLVEEFAVTGSPPQLVPQDEIHLMFTPPSLPQPRLPAGLALSADEKTLFVVCQYDGTLAIVDVAPGSPTHGLEIATTHVLGENPYDVALDEATHTAYVSLWGGHYNGPGRFDNGVVPVDISTLTMPKPQPIIATGKSPEATLFVAGKIYVAAADGDSVAAIDPMSATAALTPTAFDATRLPGSSPNALVADVAHDRLYVANAGENAVQAFQLSTMQSLGRVPTAWYPTAVALRSDGTLLILSAKGMGGAAIKDGVDKGTAMQGTLQIVPMPSTDDLRNGDAAVHDNLLRPKHYEVQLACNGAPSFPLPPKAGDDTPIKHVFYIVRENKTYDSVLGDLQGANGDPSLELWDANVTPNLHALAHDFVVFDNFYSLAEASLQGHEWTTATMANDFTEKGWETTWGRGSRPETSFSGSELTAHLAQPPLTIFELCDKMKVAYHNYGEIENILGAAIQYDVDYPGLFFNLQTKDVVKANYVVSLIRNPQFALEPLSYIGLPNDHTYGTDPGRPTPQSMIADNDEATGRIIDALSRSRYWESSIVFVVEDDPSDGGDHVEMHRSPAIVVSPWVKRGYASHVHYDVPALWHTIALLLHLDPMNQRDGNAPAMYDVFTGKADLSPYTFIPRKTPEQTNSVDAPMAAESHAIDFSRPDTAPLGRILWKAVRGADAEPPWRSKDMRHVRVRDDDD
jgi:DNA-binding beta-propeller fold protein YncE